MSKAGVDAKEAKVAERIDKTQKEFHNRVEKILKTSGVVKNANQRLIADVIGRSVDEYHKLYGRVGLHALMHIKGGKQPPRYIMDRDEVWVLYKPPLWQMGGAEERWKEKVEKLRREKRTLKEAQAEFMDSDKIENVQEWHGITQGLWFIDPEMPVTNWGFIQRLDVETDGPVVICKTWRAQRALQVQMQTHVFSKAYMCLVHGRVENKVQFIKAKFSELGMGENSVIMLKSDAVNDPFFSLDDGGGKEKRPSRNAETFFKPIAYFHRKEDNTDYSLVYVNILTGITHQVRITMQSVGHPLVSDDRYLPKEQANSDLRWCPRNFLCEVRADWFDCFGPYKDKSRMSYTRVSMENPLPKMFQEVLTNKLSLVEKLDPTADLMQGCQYWAIGDEQLMIKFPKEEEFRRKVVRWGVRQGIHLDALDRLLLLERKTIDEIINKYKPPAKDTDNWVCPVCMAFNVPNEKNEMEGGVQKCRSFARVECTGVRLVEDPKAPLPRGWQDWASDPTMHLLMIVNEKWLWARRNIFKFERPTWERPPPEKEGTEPTDDVLLVLEGALVVDAKKGGQGIPEAELRNYPGLEDIEMPLAEPPPDSNVRRVRLPGRGFESQWHYTLAGKERIKHTAGFAVKQKKIKTPLEMETGKLPEKCVPKGDDAVRMQDEKNEREAEKEKKRRAEEDERDKKADAREAAKKTARKWKKTESARCPGSFYYFDVTTGESQTEVPGDFEEKVIVWEKIESKTAAGEFYYFNKETGESRQDKPHGFAVASVDSSLSDQPREDKVKMVAVAGAKKEPLMLWKRKESASKPGNYYYFNSKTGANEVEPPVVQSPWKCIESKSTKGQYYYFNDDTSETVVDPPDSATPAPPKAAKRAAAAIPGNAAKKANVASTDGLPEGWVKKESDSHKGKFYYSHVKTGQTSWTKPTGSWEKKESKTHAGKFYYQHSLTGETSWTEKQ